MKNDRRLAILGGAPVISSALQPYKSVDEAERDALIRVFERGSLSGFYGSWCPEFFGGVEVKEFEVDWAKKFNVAHAISVNSNTSGLYASLGAIGISPGDEVIVPPTTMSATVMAPLIYGAIPVFVDIEPDTFCLDIEAVESQISNKTKAVIAVNLFGHPARLHELSRLCKSHGIKLIEDNAQAPLANENGIYTGTIGDIGVFSLNYHKHIHTGEGGMCVTDDPNLAFRLQAIRNHAENVIEHTEVSPVNMVGFNYRMTEMSAAIGRTQLAKIEKEVSKRQKIAETLTEGTSDLLGVIPPVVRKKCRHVYYVWALRVNENELGISRENFSKALTAEGFPHSLGYVRPLYLLPAFQKRVAIGRDGWPFSLTSRSYEKGLCQVAERIYEKDLLCFEPCAYDVDEKTANLFVEAIRKVYFNRHLI